MSGLTSEITAVQSSLDNLIDEESKEYLAIDADAHRRRVQTRRSFDDRRAPLLLRMAHLRAAAGDIISAPTTPMAAQRKPVPKENKKPVPKENKKGTIDIVLELLADTDQPLPASSIDAAIIAAGWSKAASEKAKSRMRDSGLIAVDKRHYTITDVGREMLAGRHSEP